MPKGAEEPFHIRARKTFERIEAETGVFHNDRTVDGLGGPARFVECDFLKRTLELREVEGGVGEVRDGGAEDRLDFAELVGVAGYKG